MPTPENREKIAWLNRYREYDREIDRKCEELSRWRSRATRVTPTLSLAPGGGGSGDSMAQAIEKIVTIEAEINAEIDRLLLIRGEVEKAIKAVPEPTLRTVLELRYIDGHTFEGTADKMNMSYQWVCVLHGRALKFISVT